MPRQVAGVILMCMWLCVGVFAQPEEMGVQLVLSEREYVPLANPVVPRYRFEVGQRLVYRSRSEIRRAEKTVFTDRVISVRVVDENPDGTWRLVICASGDTIPMPRTGSGHVPVCCRRGGAGWAPPRGVCSSRPSG